MADNASAQIDPKQLLLTKKLEPLPPEALAKLDEVEKHDVSKWSEEDVRAYVINPILEVLGYSKDKIFSADHGHVLQFLGKKRFPDYKLKLWNENFWVIEAKKPRLKQKAFVYKDLAQALEYAIHPEVNAALVVLCDGVKIEIFDREVSITDPAFSLKVTNLRQGFDELRMFLDPIQVWYFQKRRVLRMLDKVFDREFNMSRVEEFKQIVLSNLDGKTKIVLENFRAAKTHQPEEDRRRAETATLEDITDLYMYWDNPIPIVNATARRLVELSQPSSFQVMLRIFPNTVRDVSDTFMAQALKYLLEMDREGVAVGWSPRWLGHDGGDPQSRRETAIKKLLDHSLSYFAAYEPVRVVLLADRAIRRLMKVFAITNETVRQKGADLFATARHNLPEISWAQIVASPNGQLLQEIDIESRIFMRGFVRQHFGDRKINIESAKHQIRSLWGYEILLLQSIPNYRALLRERSLGEMTMTEWSSVTWDNLGHLSLALTHGYEKWRDYLRQERRQQLEEVAAMGSHSAKELLGLKATDERPPPSDEYLASRFFFGEVETFRKIRAGYRGS